MHEYIEVLMRELGCNYAEAYHAALALWSTDEGISHGLS